MKRDHVLWDTPLSQGQGTGCVLVQDNLDPHYCGKKVSATKTMAKKSSFPSGKPPSVRRCFVGRERPDPPLWTASLPLLLLSLPHDSGGVDSSSSLVLTGPAGLRLRSGDLPYGTGLSSSPSGKISLNSPEPMGWMDYQVPIVLPTGVISFPVHS